MKGLSDFLAGLSLGEDAAAAAAAATHDRREWARGGVPRAAPPLA